MAVAAAPVPQPRLGAFVRLKLRLLGNGLRGQPWRVVVFVLGVLFGAGSALIAFLGLAATAALPDDTGFAVATFVGTGLVLAWILVPLLFFGVDETLDPARFALLPLRRLTLARGMLAAAFIGVPSLATLLATTGLVLAAGLRSGPVAAVAAAVGIVAGLVLCLIASRAVTSAFATLLRSRRTRDLAGVLIALVASSGGWLQFILPTIGPGAGEKANSAAAVLAWTPLAAPYVLPFDVAAGRWAVAGERLALTLATIGLLLWWWSRTIESAMVGGNSAGAAGPVKASRSGLAPVAALVPAVLRRIVGPTVFGAILARESRFWWRDPRRRAGLVSILVATAVLPLAVILKLSDPAMPVSLRNGLAAFAVTVSGATAGLLLGNQLGYDGSAFATQLLAGVPGRVELRARAAALALTVAPVQLIVFLIVSFAARGGPGGLVSQLAVILAAFVASFGAASAAGSLLCVLAPYALPENTNPFAMNTGSGTAKGLYALLAMLATLILTVPVAIGAGLLGGSVLSAVAVFVGTLAYGGVLVWAGTGIAGRILDRRGPEILSAVTPRR